MEVKDIFKFPEMFAAEQLEAVRGLIMKSVSRLAGAFLFALTIGTPAVAAENWPDSFTEYVASVRKQIKSIDMEQFLAVTKDPKGALLVDVREEDEYVGGHIPGVINIPRGWLEVQIWRKVGYPNNLNMAYPIYLHCGTGTRCTLAAKSLQDLGFTNVVAANFMIADWKKKGYPIKTEEMKLK